MLSVGLVVDDAIVMVENVERHLHLGETPFQAALRAARELVGPIIAMTITLAAVYAPIGLQGGLTGSLFREFAFTLAGAVIISGVVALTLSPMMGVQAAPRGRHARRASRAGSTGVRRRARRLTRARWPGRCTTGRSSSSSGRSSRCSIVPFYMFSQKELAPAEDQSVVFGIIQAAANATLDQTKLFAQQINDVYQSFPETDSIFQITFPTGGFGGMVTKPWSERTKSRQQLQMESAGAAVQDPGRARHPARARRRSPAAGTSRSTS